MSTTSREPWKAAVLALAYPGLGHLYVRRWGRGLLWFLLIISIPVSFLPVEAIPSTLSVDAFVTAAEAVPIYVPVLWGIMTGLSVRDAYVIARREATVQAARERGEGPMYCPHCGQELEDRTLDFCQWCAEPLDEEPEDDGNSVTPW